jgi:hypothetical protein
MTLVVFLGPSLPLADARRVLDRAVYLPPVRQGDLASAVGTYAPTAVGIIDGEFGQSLSVWHKEVLFALSCGVHVFGASSMGALRAAETAEFGTVGVGRIYAQYADGTLTDDDEVALAHGTADSGYRPLSVPMVNIRAALAAAVAAGVLPPAIHDRVIDGCKALFFPDRSYAAVLRLAGEAGASAGEVAALRAFVRAHAPDLKRDDALALLERLRALPEPLAPFVPAFTFERTRNFETLYDHDRTVQRDGAAVPLGAVAAHVALHAPAFNALNGHALDRALADVLAEVLGVAASPDDVAAERKRFRVERRLDDEAALAAWRAANDLRGDEFEALLGALARRRLLHRWLIQRRSYARTARLVLDELRLSGEYDAWVRRAIAHERLLGADAADAADAADEAFSPAQLAIEHMRATPCRIPIPVDQWAAEAGLEGVVHLRMELLRGRAARRRLRRATEHAALGATPSAEAAR